MPWISIGPPWALTVTIRLFLWFFFYKSISLGISAIKTTTFTSSSATTLNCEENYAPINTHIIPRHGPPMAPLKSNPRQLGINLDNLPRKTLHHSLENLVAAIKSHSFAIIELIWGGDDGIVRAYFKHIFSRLILAAIDGKGIIPPINGPPIR